MKEGLCWGFLESSYILRHFFLPVWRLYWRLRSLNRLLKQRKEKKSRLKRCCQHADTNKFRKFGLHTYITVHLKHYSFWILLGLSIQPQKDLKKFVVACTNNHNFGVNALVIKMFIQIYWSYLSAFTLSRFKFLRKNTERLGKIRETIF